MAVSHRHTRLYGPSRYIILHAGRVDRISVSSTERPAGAMSAYCTWAEATRCGCVSSTERPSGGYVGWCIYLINKTDSKGYNL